MGEKVAALVLHAEADSWRGLKAALKNECVEVHEAQTCQEARAWLERRTPPQLVFTDARLPDGTWTDILHLAERAASPVDVIVVSRQLDERLYADVIQSGAYDYIAPPLAVPDLGHIVRGAIWNVHDRREILAHAA